MKKFLLLISIVFASIISIAQTYTVSYYAVDKDKSTTTIVFYQKDSTAGAVGIEWVATDGNTYLVVGGGSLPNFSPDNREADNVFRKYIKVGTTYGFLYEYRRTISDANYIYGNPTKPNFGNYEDDPFLIDGVTLKSADLITEAQFFIDNIIKNKHGLPVSISQFVIESIIKIEGL